MPNQPKTPARTFRLDDATMEQIGDLADTFGSLTQAVRGAVRSLHAVMVAQGMTRAFHAQKIRDLMGLNECAIYAVDSESQLPESSRIMLNGATRYAEWLTGGPGDELELAVRQEERERTIRDMISRLEGHVTTGDVSPDAVAMLKSLLP